MPEPKSPPQFATVFTVSSVESCRRIYHHFLTTHRLKPPFPDCKSSKAGKVIITTACHLIWCGGHVRVTGRCATRTLKAGACPRRKCRDLAIGKPTTTPPAPSHAQTEGEGKAHHGCPRRSTTAQRQSGESPMAKARNRGV